MGSNPISLSAVNFRAFLRDSAWKVRTFLRLAPQKFIENWSADRCEAVLREQTVRRSTKKRRSNIRYCESFWQSLSKRLPLKTLLVRAHLGYCRAPKAAIEKARNIWRISKKFNLILSHLSFFWRRAGLFSFFHGLFRSRQMWQPLLRSEGATEYADPLPLYKCSVSHYFLKICNTFVTPKVI